MEFLKFIRDVLRATWPLLIGAVLLGAVSYASQSKVTKEYQAYEFAVRGETTFYEVHVLARKKIQSISIK